MSVIIGECRGDMKARSRLQECSKEELIEFIIDYRKRSDDTGVWRWATEHELERLQQIIRSEYHNDKSIRHAQHVADLEAKNRTLKEEIRYMQLKAEDHNATAYATNLIINCTGCRAGGPAFPDDLTDERVAKVKQIADRLETWWKNEKWRRERAAKSSG